MCVGGRGDCMCVCLCIEREGKKEGGGRGKEIEGRKGGRKRKEAKVMERDDKTKKWKKKRTGIR